MSLGITGGMLSLIPYLASTLVYIVQFCAIDDGSPYASQMYNDMIHSFLVYNMIPLVVAVAGFTREPAG